MASSAPNGSSISSSPASWARARARAARWRIPPDSSWGRLGPKPARWTRSSRSAATAPPFGLAHAAEPERQLDVGGHGEPREERRVLEEHGRGGAARPAGRRVAGRCAVGAGIRSTVMSTVPTVGPVQPGDQVEQGGLSAPGGPDQADELARRRRSSVDVLEGDHRRRPPPYRLDTPVRVTAGARALIRRVGGRRELGHDVSVAFPAGQDLVDRSEVEDARDAGGGEPGRLGVGHVGHDRRGDGVVGECHVGPGAWPARWA